MLLLLAACAGPTPDDSKPDTDTVDTDTDTDTGRDTDTSTDTAPPDPNDAPGAAEIVITPTTPPVGADFSVTIVTPSVDPDGDAVSYRYAWTVDGVPVDIADALVPGASATLGQRWEVTVTPTDGELDGPTATAAAVIGNSPPTAPGLAILPEDPEENDELTLVIDPAPVDPDGDPLTTTITWYQDDSWVPWLDGLTTVDGAYVDIPETWRAVVSVTDGFNDPVTAEITVELAYGCANLPPYNDGDTTLSDARAYHGLEFDDDGYLLGYDGRGSIARTAYDGTREVFLPGVGVLQQFDRFPNGDWVYADNSNQTLVRLDASGGKTVIASSGIGSAYGVTVGPDEMVYIAYPDVKRVDPTTGEVETLITSSGVTYHVLEFNLDSTVMYLGTIGSGSVYEVALDADLNPVGTPTVFATRVGSGWHDGIGIDECGNLWVADYSSRGLYRVEPDATVTSMADPDPTAYGHGLKWGSGIGGWREDALYLPQPYNGNTVREVVIGFKRGDDLRTWNGVPVPW